MSRSTSTSDFLLRDYQLEALKRVEEKFAQGYRSVLLSMPTGAGKTVVFNTLILKRGFRALVVAHREELLSQAVDKYLMCGGSPSDVGIIKAGEWKENRYTVASIQTLYRNLDRLSARDYDLVVIDEVHHSPAPTYRAVIDRLRETNPEIRLLGVTATPFRADEGDLFSLFEVLAYAVDILDLIGSGYLVPVRGRVVRLPVDVSDLRVSGEDYHVKRIAELFDRGDLNDLVVEEWIRLSGGRKTVVYVSTVDHAVHLAGRFSAKGVPVRVVYGSMSSAERRRALEEFRDGRVQVLVNVNVLTEGFDDPSVSCVLTVRPTASLPLYIQMVGRGLRLAPGKRDCLIIDCYGINLPPSLVGFPELFGLSDRDREAFMNGEEVSIYPRRDGKGAVVHVGEVSLEFDRMDAYLYATRIGKDVVVSCGLSGKSLVLRKEGDFYSLYSISREGTRLVRKGLTADYAWTTLTAVWERERDGFMERFKDGGFDRKPTEAQMKYIMRAISRGYLDPSLLEKRLEELSRLDASNILCYLFLVAPRDVFREGVSLKFGKEGLYVAETGYGIRLAHAVLLEDLGHRVFYPARSLKRVVETRSLGEAERWLFVRIPDLKMQVAEISLLERGSLAVLREWIGKVKELGRVEELKAWLRENRWRVKKVSGGSRFIFTRESGGKDEAVELFRAWFSFVYEKQGAGVG